MKMRFIKLGWNCYQLVEDFQIDTGMKGRPIRHDQFGLDEFGILTIYKYFTWDGPTWGINTKTFVKGSCVHDVLCIAINLNLMPKWEQKNVDKLMAKINEEENMWLPRVLWTYIGVRIYMKQKKKPFKPKVYEV